MAFDHSMFTLVLQFILLPLLNINAQQTSPIKVGTTLSTNNSTWLSPSGEFALGFHQVDSSSYLLAIWYTKVPETLVWYAGPDGVLAPEGSVLTCAADQGGLVIKGPQGQNLYTNLNMTAGKVGYCSLNDTGNLLTKGAKGNTIWQSFDHPTDTLLPSQNVGKLSPILYSRHSNSSFARGKFQMRLLDDGNLVLNTRSLVTDFAYDGAYYVSGTMDSTNASNSGYMVSYNVSGHMYILKNNGDQVDLLQGATFPSPTKDYYFRATLNPDGVLVWYYHKKDRSSTWTVLNWQPDNICQRKTGTMDGGVCGFNSICKINPAASDYPAPMCECPPRYSFLDANDTFGGCKPDFKLPASNKDVGYRLERLPMIDWPMRDYDLLYPFTEDECKNSCLNDYVCVASVLNDKKCWKKGTPLINGRVDASRTVFLKVSDVDDDGNNSQLLTPPTPNLRRNWKPMSPLVSVGDFD